MKRGRPFEMEWEESAEELFEAYRQEKEVQRRTRLQALWLLRQGRSLEEGSQIVGVSYRTLQRWVAGSASAHTGTWRPRGALLSNSATRGAGESPGGQRRVSDSTRSSAMDPTAVGNTIYIQGHLWIVSPSAVEKESAASPIRARLR
jgi:hypothetical protein